MTSTIKVNTITTESGSTLTVGGCGKTVALASGASQTGFGRTGTVDWQTSSIKTATFTAVNGKGYFCNTSGGAFNMNLPAGSAGAIVSVVDYTNTFQNNALTVVPNGSEKIGGVAANVSLTTEGQSVTFVYVDSTEGWKNVQDSTSNVTGRTFLTATGGTVTTSGNCKIHTFTGPGTFCVSALSSNAPENMVSYMVVAGGAGGAGNQGSWGGGGGGAGGYRELKNPVTPYTASPLDGYCTPANRITVTATGFPITVGAGGAGGPACGSGSPGVGANGANSVFSSITSTGGGGGGAGHPGPRNQAQAAGQNGGSGGGATSAYNASPSGTASGGSGNTPPVTPSQGNPGGNAAPHPPARQGGGGGGATAAGGNCSGPGGAGATSSINGTPTARAGGGGAGGVSPGSSSPGGAGGGGAGSNSPSIATAGTVNTGGGGGGNGPCASKAGAAGGSGIVIIRYKFQ
jgi:hypothetical protein